MLIVCDANVWIEASNDPTSWLTRLLAIASAKNWRLGISRHSVRELEHGTENHGVRAAALAQRAEILPYFPIGQIDELVGAIHDLAGTLDDIRENDQLRTRLGVLAKKGTDIRDRGAIIDSLHARAAYFVTSDKGLVGDGPRTRILETLGLRILRPAEMCVVMCESSCGAG